MVHQTWVGAPDAVNENGIEAFEPGATLWLAQSTVTGNTVHGFIAQSGAVTKSYGDSYRAADNGAPIGSLSSVARQ